MREDFFYQGSVFVCFGVTNPADRLIERPMKGTLSVSMVSTGQNVLVLIGYRKALKRCRRILCQD